MFDFVACYHAYQQLTKTFESQGRNNHFAKSRQRTDENTLQNIYAFSKQFKALKLLCSGAFAASFWAET